ncbi:SIR2-domain-containing protein [Sodiomyces alkalinus F11]|uniref:SIR2-domain-containing protein n=1 Tax=Sodiomyces alkalinus (strain CBS 110278 / VKM F-3762 / F11) TaxID=1314773 RepID=A0A3N2Q2V8_SODAK|nr:SIR2-domain-containing protein [Sodiomyces alkalinus F11]ROT41008.1 SIR2-domain-containing protein [Sodiomyces alkalinus F11]
MGNEESVLDEANGPPQTLGDRSLESLAHYIKDAPAWRIVVMCGAGISTAAGIPDFRSPGTGLYDNLARLNLPYAEAVFDIEYFRKHPEPFYYLAKELYPGKFHPTISHAFIALLAKKGRLLMNFTQNIDCLERRAGVPADKIVEAHGSFATQRCIECRTPFPDDDMLDHVQREVVPRCKDRSCGGLVKPDIVFFGEALPSAFRDASHLPAMADLVIVMGTSLSVYPFAGLPEYAQPHVPRLLLNKERVGRMGYRPDDVLELGPCDAGIRRLAALLGWSEELEALWRGVVRDEEAARQVARVDPDAGAGRADIEDEIRKLTEEVEAALTLESPNDESAAGGDKTEEKDGLADVGAKVEEEVETDRKEEVSRTGGEEGVTLHSRGGEEEREDEKASSGPAENADRAAAVPAPDASSRSALGGDDGPSAQEELQLRLGGDVPSGGGGDGKSGRPAGSPGGDILGGEDAVKGGEASSKLS